MKYIVTITRSRVVWDIAQTEVDAESDNAALDMVADEDFSTFAWKEEDCDTHDISYTAELATWPRSAQSEKSSPAT